jgi:hypothetical protein
MVLDCTEYRIQAHASRKSTRTIWIYYKEAHTAKILVAVAPSGALCGHQMRSHVVLRTSKFASIVYIKACETLGMVYTLTKGLMA